MHKAKSLTIYLLVGCCLAVLILSGPVAAQQENDPFESSIGGMIWDELGNALDAKNEANANIAAFNQDIAHFRERFWQLFPDKPGFADAEKEFSHALAEKDWYYLTMSVPEGVDGRTAELMRAMTAQPDGGIRPEAENAFNNWVKRLRYRLGAQGDNDMILVLPDRLLNGIRQERGSTHTYQIARDMAEFKVAGRDIQVYLNKYRDPKTYAIWLLETRLIANRSGWAPGIEWPDPDEAARNLYNIIAEGIGEENVLASAKTVIDAPKDAVGDLAEEVSITFAGGSPRKTKQPFDWFESLLGSSNRGYAVALHGNSKAEYTAGWNIAISSYRKVIDAYGEQKVLAAAEKVRLAPKNVEGMVAGNPPQWPSDMFRKLLSGPDSGYPTDPKYPRFAATDFEGLKKEGDWRNPQRSKRVVVYGIVDRVTEEYQPGMVPPPGTPENVLKVYPKIQVMHFKNVPDDAVVARVTGYREKMPLGEDLSQYIGRTVEFEISPTLPEQDNKIWLGVDGRLFKVLP